ncbi:MAG: hypothetical protein IKQ25_08550 [Lachnospiraceae bacterium]|nr:hypothetical protein [Lachnospiraceae bacterium]
MKKMKFVTKGLALLMMGVMLAGCSDKATDASESTKQESVSNDKSSEATSSEVATGEASGSEATSSEATSSEATSSEASSSEATSTETSSEAQGQTGSVDDARIAQYEEYFKNFSMDNKLFSMHLEGEEDGVKINFDMKFGAKDGNSFLQIAMPGQGDTNSLTAYFMKDNSAYMELKVAGSDPVMQKTTGMDSAVAEELNPGRELVNIGPENNEDVKLAFVREETIDGVAYDVLKPVDSDEALVYMNQKTKEWEKMMAKADGQEVLVDILPADDFSLPASYATAEEVDSETFTMTLAFGMIGLMAGGQ